MIDALFGMTLIAYLGALAGHIWSLTGGRKSSIANGLAALGWAAQGMGIIARGIEIGRVPLTNLYESLTFLTWALVTIYLFLQRRKRIPALSAFVMFVAVIVTTLASGLPKDTVLHPALHSRWLTIHVISSLAGYASFIIAFAATLGYLLQERLLKSKRINGLQQQLPSLDAVDHLAYKMVALGFPMLTLGVVTGAMWAQTAWGSYWSWDPKETWSLVTWLVYAVYLHMRIVRGWRGKWANRLLLIGFAAVLVTFFGVNYIPHGMHRYS